MAILDYFEKVSKTRLQAMSSAPTENGIGVVNLTVREIEEVKMKSLCWRPKVESEENTSSGHRRKEQK